MFIPDIEFEQSRALSAVPRQPMGEFPENVHIACCTNDESLFYILLTVHLFTESC